MTMPVVTGILGGGAPQPPIMVPVSFSQTYDLDAQKAGGIYESRTFLRC